MVLEEVRLFIDEELLRGLKLHLLEKIFSGKHVRSLNPLFMMLFYVLSLPRYKSFDLMVDDIMFSNGLLYSLEIYLSAVNLQVFTDRSLKQMQTARVQIQLPEVKTLQPFLL